MAVLWLAVLQWSREVQDSINFILYICSYITGLYRQYLMNTCIICYILLECVCYILLVCILYNMYVSRGGLFLPLLIGRHPHGVGGGILRELRELGRLLCGREGGGRGGGTVYGPHRKLDIYIVVHSLSQTQSRYVGRAAIKPYHSFAFSSF